MGYIVYRHTSPNGKIYIGITSRTPNERWQNGNGYLNNKHFFNAIKKYGWNNFKHDILKENLSKEDAEYLEIQLIAKYQSTDPKKGYNVSSGGQSTNGYRHSDETKLKISESLKGKTHSKETKENESKAHKKLWSDSSYRKRMSIAHIGKRCGKNHPMAKKVLQYDLNMLIVAAYGSISEAEKETKIDHRVISACCNGKQKTAKGYYWKYADV